MEYIEDGPYEIIKVLNAAAAPATESVVPAAQEKAETPLVPPARILPPEAQAAPEDAPAPASANDGTAPGETVAIS